jgi:hypothetical protein
MIGIVGCTNDLSEKNESDVILVMLSIAADEGSGPGSGVGSVLLSDVVSEGSVFNDNATMTIEALAKNPATTNLGRYNDVMFESYEVKYWRSDGHSVEGVDVPFRITGPLAILLPCPGTTQVPIVVVRHAAKVEPPLKNLRGSGGLSILTVFADITLYGKTLNGKVVQVMGRLQITFADFGD